MDTEPEEETKEEIHMDPENLEQPKQQEEEKTEKKAEENTRSEGWIINIVEFSRIALCVASFVIGFSENVPNYFAISAGLFVFSMAGITGLESLLIGDASARAKKWPTGTPYQKQSAMNNLGTTVAMIVALSLGANDAALAVLMIAVASFIGLSGMNHLYAALRDKCAGKEVAFIHYTRFLLSIPLVVVVSIIVNQRQPFQA